MCQIFTGKFYRIGMFYLSGDNTVIVGFALDNKAQIVQILYGRYIAFLTGFTQISQAVCRISGFINHIGAVFDIAQNGRMRFHIRHTSCRLYRRFTRIRCIIFIADRIIIFPVLSSNQRLIIGIDITNLCESVIEEFLFNRFPGFFTVNGYRNFSRIFAFTGTGDFRQIITEERNFIRIGYRSGISVFWHLDNPSEFTHVTYIDCQIILNTCQISHTVRR